MKKKKILFAQITAFGRGEFKQIGSTYKHVDPSSPDYDYLLVGTNPYRKYEEPECYRAIPDEHKLDLTSTNLKANWGKTLVELMRRYHKKYEAIAFIDDDAHVGGLENVATLYSKEFKRLPRLGWLGHVPYPYVLSLPQQERKRLKDQCKIVNGAPWSTFGMQVMNTAMYPELKGEFEYLANKITFKYDVTTYLTSYLFGWDWGAVDHIYSHTCHGHTVYTDSQAQYVINGRTQDLETCILRSLTTGSKGLWKRDYREGLKAIRSAACSFQVEIRKFRSKISNERRTLEDPKFINRFMDLNEKGE